MKLVRANRNYFKEKCREKYNLKNWKKSSIRWIKVRNKKKTIEKNIFSKAMGVCVCV